MNQKDFFTSKPSAIAPAIGLLMTGIIAFLAAGCGEAQQKPANAPVAQTVKAVKPPVVAQAQTAPPIPARPPAVEAAPEVPPPPKVAPPKRAPVPARAVQVRRAAVRAALAAQPPEADAPAEEPQETILVVTALDPETEKPIVGMHLRATGSGAQRAMPMGTFDTDEKGRAEIYLPPSQLNAVSLVTSADGYPPYTIRWQTAKELKSDTNYVFKPARAILVGGIVNDESGQPVEGAKVAMSLASQPTTAAKRERVSFGGHFETTDQDGKWFCSHVPAGHVAKLNFDLSHPDFLDTPLRGPGAAPDAAKLVSSNAVLVIRKGVTIAGVVTGPNGKPVDGASVLLGEKYGRQKKIEYTDSEGKFSLRNCAPGVDAALTIQAEGMAPESKTVQATKEMPEVKIALEKGNLLKGKVVDSKGEALPGVSAEVSTWRDRQTLDWKTTTDDQGKFEWNSAPKDAVTLSFTLADFTPTGGSYTANGTEHKVTLRKAPMLAGKVTDVETGKPILDFTATPGIGWGGDSINWMAHRKQQGQEGNYSVAFDQQGQEYAVKIQAVGYLPQMSKGIQPDRTEDPVNFQLKKGAGPSGIVLGIDGKPAAGAEVTVNSRSEQINIKRGRFQMNGMPSNTTDSRTDTEGKFSIMADVEATKVIAINSQGYGETTLEGLATNNIIQLQPFGTIQGVLKAGTNIVAGEYLYLTPRMNGNRDNVYFDFTDFKVTTDADGRFSMESVPPGKYAIATLVPMGGPDGPRGWMHNNPRPVEILPGKTNRLTIGGTGRAVTGKLEISDKDVKVNWPNSRISVNSKMPTPPSGFRTPGDYRVWQNSPEYKEAMSKFISLAGKLKSDGTFRIDDVSAGNYQFNASITDGDDPFAGGRNLGNASQEFTIPEMPGGWSDEPLDLGTIHVRINQQRQGGLQFQ